MPEHPLPSMAVGAVISGLCLTPSVAAAGITVYQEGDKFVKIGGRIQLQYHYEDPDHADPLVSDDSSDDLFFRRFRVYVEGGLYKDWSGKFQWEMGKAKDDDELQVKDAFMQYTGVRNLKIRLGNNDFAFSREYLTSTKRLQLVERPFTGDHNYGVPDKNLGLHFIGHAAGKKITYGASAASASIDPDVKKLDFDTPVNRDDDFNEGWMAGGRVEFHPLGEIKYAQGDFDRDVKFAVGAGAYRWSNDDDNNTYTKDDGTLEGEAFEDGNLVKVDVDDVTGAEASASFRGYGLSIDGQYNSYEADSVVSNVTAGIFENGEADLESYSVKGGYMVIPSRLELAAGYQVLDADTYAEEWTRTSFGLNWFIKKHDIKLQLTHRVGENVDGVKDEDLDEAFLQAQYIF